MQGRGNLGEDKKKKWWGKQDQESPLWYQMAYLLGRVTVLIS